LGSLGCAPGLGQLRAGLAPAQCAEPPVARRPRRRPGEGSLLPLWKFGSDKSKRRQVTSICWNPQYDDMFAVGYGSYEFLKQASGLIHIFSLKNPSHPEFTFTTESGVMALHFHPEFSNLLAVGCYDGSVLVFDVGLKREEPIYSASVRTGKPSDPVWQVAWQVSERTSAPWAAQAMGWRARGVGAGLGVRRRGLGSQRRTGPCTAVQPCGAWVDARARARARAPVAAPMPVSPCRGRAAELARACVVWCVCRWTRRRRLCSSCPCPPTAPSTCGTSPSPSSSPSRS
jgi:hypothetical protein